MTVHAARTRIQIEFIEMPGLKLTLPQIARLCDLPKELCEPAVSSLVDGGFLARTPDGSFLCRGLVRQADGILGPQALAITP
jgi:hypothetical protein